MPDDRARLAWGLIGLTAALQGLRLLVAADTLARGDVVRPPGADRRQEDGQDRRQDGREDGPITVLVPIRSGDPLLAPTLAAQVDALDRAHVLLLVDDDDAAGHAAAQSARTRAPHRVAVRSFPPADPGTNPKVTKLAAAQPDEGVVVLLDDDTVLPRAALTRMVAALAHGDLVTGIPVYREQGTVWARLLAAFVNGGALLTHPVLARTGPPVTVNGMALVCRASTLARLGGLASIAHEVCDDYALARLVRSAGGRIVQTTVAHPVATTVASPGEYARIQRRWLLFAQQVVRGDLSAAMVVLVLVPSALPLLALVTTLAARSRSAVAGAVGVGFAKALALRVLRRRLHPGAGSRRGVLLEVVADVLTPLHLARAAVGGRTAVSWRDRQVVTGDDGAPVAVRAARTAPGAVHAPRTVPSAGRARTAAARP
nr:glycosyltransferase [uncultured Actinotalea sp.]